MSAVPADPALLPPRFPFDWACDWGEDRYGPWVAFRAAGVRQALRWVTPGSFQGERAHRTILTRGLWLADTACTQALWEAVMGRNPSRFEGPERPVEQVSWDDSIVFLERLNALVPGLDARLPTECEWEHACRAGTETAFWFGDAITTDQVNYNGNYPTDGAPKGPFREQTVDVTVLPCNPWGLYQMHGNVWEWCQDWYGELPDAELRDYQGPEAGVERVCRGGSWVYDAVYCRSGQRYLRHPGTRFGTLGFRLARGP